MLDNVYLVKQGFQVTNVRSKNIIEKLCNIHCSRPGSRNVFFLRIGLFLTIFQNIIEIKR